MTCWMYSLAANMIHAPLYLHDLDSLHSFQRTGFSSLKLYIIYIYKSWLSVIVHVLIILYAYFTCCWMWAGFPSSPEHCQWVYGLFYSLQSPSTQVCSSCSVSLLSSFTDIHSIVVTLLATNIWSHHQLGAFLCAVFITMWWPVFSAWPPSSTLDEQLLWLHANNYFWFLVPSQV